MTCAFPGSCRSFVSTPVPVWNPTRSYGCARLAKSVALPERKIRTMFSEIWEGGGCEGNCAIFGCGLAKRKCGRKMRKNALALAGNPYEIGPRN
jgi:hypothetical protein